MRYAQGGGLTAEGRRRREQVRLEAAKRFEQRAPAAVIAGLDVWGIEGPDVGLMRRLKRLKGK